MPRESVMVVRLRNSSSFSVALSAGKAPPATRVAMPCASWQT